MLLWKNQLLVLRYICRKSLLSVLTRTMENTGPCNSLLRIYIYICSCYSYMLLWKNQLLVLRYICRKSLLSVLTRTTENTGPCNSLLRIYICSCYSYMLLWKKPTVSAHTHTHFYNCVHMYVYVCISFEQGDGCGKPGANAGCEGQVSRPETTARGKHRQN